MVESFTKEEVVVTLEHDVCKLDLTASIFSVLSNVESKLIENRFNDGKCNPLGNLWVGSMHLNQKKEQGSLYKIDKAGNVK